MKHTDFLGNPIAVGDMVAYVEPQYRSLRKGKVLRLTPKGFQVEHFTWRGEAEKLFRTRDYVVKVIA